MKKLNLLVISAIVSVRAFAGETAINEGHERQHLASGDLVCQGAKDAGSDDERSFKVKVSNLSADDSSQVNLDVEEVWGGGEELDTDSLNQANSEVTKSGDIVTIEQAAASTSGLLKGFNVSINLSTLKGQIKMAISPSGADHVRVPVQCVRQ
ncbi:MAG: hypothetical protein WCO71_08280 [Pseudomonadota bacterium]